MEFSPPPPPPPTQEPVSRPARRRRLPHAAMAGGLVFGMALGGAGIAFAAGSGSGTGSGSSTTSPSAPNKTAPPFAGRHKGHMGRMGGAELGRLGLGGRVLYGQATIQTPSGATKTIDFQVGTVSAVSSTSITVQSGTGTVHTQTYTVQPSTIVDSQADGIGSVKSGDKVIVIAQDNGSGNPTAMDIRDQTQMRNSRQGFGYGAPSPNGQNNGSSANQPAGSAGTVWGPGGFEAQ